jgi:hypothetical protein
MNIADEDKSIGKTKIQVSIKESVSVFYNFFCPISLYKTGSIIQKL